MWPVNSPTATRSFCLLIAWGPFVLLDTGPLIRVWDWRQPLQVFHLFWCSCLKCLFMTSLPTTKGIPTIWSEGSPLFPSLANLSASSFPGIPWRSGFSTKVTLLYLHTFSSVCVLSHTRANAVGFLQVLLLLPCYQSRYVLTQEEFYAPQNCHHFSLKRCRQAAHSITLLMVVPWSINTCTKRLLISDPSVSKCHR